MYLKAYHKLQVKRSFVTSIWNKHTHRFTQLPNAKNVISSKISR